MGSHNVCFMQKRQQKVVLFTFHIKMVILSVSEMIFFFFFFFVVFQDNHTYATVMPPDKVFFFQPKSNMK